MSSGRSPKEELNMAAQRHKLKLQYSSEPLEGPEGGFHCALTVSGLPGDPRTSSSAVFHGTAKRKKAAEASAAAEALSSLKASGLQLGGGNALPGSLHSFAWEALAEACATKAERELRFLCEEAERDSRGPQAVPVSAALGAKALVRWCDGKMSAEAIPPRASTDNLLSRGTGTAAAAAPPPALAARGRLWLVIQDLRKNPPQPEAPVAVSSDGLAFRRCLSEPPRERQERLQKGSGQEGPAGSVRALVVPADAASGMREADLDTSLPHLEQIAAALIGCSGASSRLLHHGKIGAPVRLQMLLLQPPEASSSTPLAESDGRVSHLPSLYTTLPASWATSGEPRQQQQEQKKQKEEEEKGPSDALPLNLRASWLAGSPVEGDALLSIARINKGDGSTVWGSFGIPEALRLWAELLPEARMAAALGAPELCRLPTSFSPFAWGASPKPRELLRACCSGLCFEPPVFEHRRQHQAAAEGGAGRGGGARGPEGGAAAAETCTATARSLRPLPSGDCCSEQQQGAPVALERTAAAPSSFEGAHGAQERLEEEAALLLLGDLQELAASRLMLPQVAQGLEEEEEEELEGGSLCSSCALHDVQQRHELLANAEVDTTALTGIRRIESDSLVHLLVTTRGCGEGQGAASAEEADEPRRLVVALGTGMLDPEVERLILRLEGVGGSGSAELQAASSRGPEGPEGVDIRAGHRLTAAASGALLRGYLESNEEHHKHQSSSRPQPHRKIRLELSVKYVRGTGAQDSHGGLFCPSLAQQRYRFVEDILSRFRPKAIVDVGCGEAALLEHLVGKGLEQAATEGGGGGSGTKQPPHHQDICHLPRTILGVDVSEEALQRAYDTLSSVPLPGLVVSRLSWPDRRDLAEFLKAAAASGAAPGPKIGLLRQDFTASGLEEHHEQGSWSTLIAECDMVVMVEVIEHLDPEPLQCVAPVLLGAIRPLVCVVTTPNIEYNAVIRGAAKRKGEDKGRLRNPDHRFEWTRAEFQAWARAAAEKFGYEVTFEGVGKAVKEAEVLYELAQEQGVDALDLGPATQVRGEALAACPEVPEPGETFGPVPSYCLQHGVIRHMHLSCLHTLLPGAL